MSWLLSHNMLKWCSVPACDHCQTLIDRGKSHKLPNVITKQVIEKLWILTTPEILDINNGYSRVSDGWNYILDLSVEDEIESHFHAPHASLGLCHATVAGHDNSPANACLHPSQDPHGHADPGT